MPATKTLFTSAVAEKCGIHRPQVYKYAKRLGVEQDSFGRWPSTLVKKIRAYRAEQRDPREGQRANALEIDGDQLRVLRREARRVRVLAVVPLTAAIMDTLRGLI